MSNQLPEDFTRQEVDFLTNELGVQPNEHGAFVYQTPDENSIIGLDFVLRHYRSWLVEKRIVKECD